MQREADLHEAHQEHHAEPVRLAEAQRPCLSCSSPVWRARGTTGGRPSGKQCGSKRGPSLLGVAGLATSSGRFQREDGFGFARFQVNDGRLQGEVAAPVTYALNTLGRRNTKGASSRHQVPVKPCLGARARHGLLSELVGDPNSGSQGVANARRCHLGGRARRRPGPQLRIVLLTREASQIVRSVCDKRNFAKRRWLRGGANFSIGCWYLVSTTRGAAASTFGNLRARALR